MRPTQKKQKKSVKRPMRLTDVLLSISLFVFLLSFTIFAVTHFSGNANNLASRTNQSHAVSAHNEPLFYSSIGTAPIDFAADAAEDQRGFSSESYTLEIKIAYSRNEAEQIVSSLTTRGIDAYYTPLQRGPQVVYRIRRGIFPDESLAARAAASLRTESGLVTKVVRLQ